MTLRAVRGAVQVERDEPGVLRGQVGLLLKEIMAANDLVPDDLVSIVFTSTPDLVSAFPAEAAWARVGHPPRSGEVNLTLLFAPARNSTVGRGSP